LPFAGLELAFDVDLGALAQILLDDPAQVLVEDHDGVPLRLLAALARGFIAPALAGCDPEVGDRPPVLRAADLGILAEIADQDHLVHRTCHHDLLTLRRRPASVRVQHSTCPIRVASAYPANARRSNLSTVLAFSLRSTLMQAYLRRKGRTAGDPDRSIGRHGRACLDGLGGWGARPLYAVHGHRQIANRLLRHGAGGRAVLLPQAVVDGGDTALELRSVGALGHSGRHRAVRPPRMTHDAEEVICQG